VAHGPYRFLVVANKVVVEAPALPTSAPPKDPKAEMEDFLDDLLG
jgi:hypothetical protein